MNSSLKIDPSRLLIFHELTTRKIYVGELLYDENRDVYILRYDENYTHLKNAIAISPELDLFKITHISKKGQLFPAFVDRIPDRENPAYADYCRAQSISIDETNPIILLGSIGGRGPSSFIFEKTYKASFSIEDVKKLRQNLNISQHDFADAFGISKVTLQKIEAGISSDTRTMKLLQIYLTFPEVAIWQLYQTGSKVHSSVLSRLFTYLHEKRTNLT